DVYKRQDQKNLMLLGLYTRTAGDPIRAVQGLLDTLTHIQTTYQISFTVLSCATTGSGRKLIGAIIGADGIIDEITAHARAAVTLDPSVDTIIEIGGQDSKFTVLKDGVVVFSQMNTVCAAGTGSFIEEQANKLGVPIRDYADRAFGHPAPATSDRCTVFMERDLNNYQNEGYTVEELLVATLFSVCDNYLSKVAMEGSIGNHIVFQGATAKNKTLVAAFERRLGKPIAVSPYCHLTGAMGAILQYQEDYRKGKTQSLAQEAVDSLNSNDKNQPPGLTQREGQREPPQSSSGPLLERKSAFKGFHLAYENIEQRNDLCSGCPNHCKLHIITVQGEEIVYGYLCGRGAGDRTYVSRNRSGFDLIRERRVLLEQCVQRIGNPSQKQKHQTLVEKLSSAVVEFSTGTIDLFNDYLYQAAERALQGLSRKEPLKEDTQAPDSLRHIKIGIPRALYLQEDWRLWQYLFQSLGFTVVLGEDTSSSLIQGKRIAGADFCAPISMIHGQTEALLQNCDYVFMPIYLEAPPRQDQKPATHDKERRFYCNYSQYVPMLVSVATGTPERLLRPLIYAPFGKSEQAVEELRESLRPLYQKLGRELPRPSFIEKLLRDIHRIKQAYDETLKELYTKVRPEEEEFAIVLTGRPYTALSKGMNKGIPDLFAEHGLKVFFHDMLPPSQHWQQEHQLQAYHWYYASKVVETALYCRDTPQVYPVLVTSFKCGPDSFAMETFKRILDEAEKPYLILQVDEHDSAVGYETRVEAAVRAFRNHFSNVQRAVPPATRRQEKSPVQAEPSDKTIPLVAKGIISAQKVFPRDKTVLLPSWDPLVCQLLAAALRGNGIDAHVLEEKRDYIQRAMTYNSGQCIPVSVIAYETKTYIEQHTLDPARTALWMVRALWPCNIPLYPLQLETIFEREGNGLEQIQIYHGDMVFFDVSPRMTLDAYYAFALGGLLRKIGCRLRPYEKIKGSTDSFIQKALERCVETLEKHQSMTALIQEIGTTMNYIERSEQPRPKVAIFGDFYVRDNEIFNQDLIKAIEKAGGEVVITSYVEYLKATVDAFFERLLIERRYGPWMAYRTVMAAISSVERRLARRTGVRLSEGSWTNKKRHLAYTFLGLRPEMSGENYDNVLKVLKLLDEYPDINLFVQAAPAFCCASLVTEGMSQAIETLTGVPVLTITYDGTGAYKNDLVEPYLAKYGT
ncbi:MAG: acyl-CoA dehydratase activase-related protein, partial [Treponemataceae bacterium]|nr:acyl-CoA dehydratase activase-related protein [Treponemataceae bacterium]